MNVASSIQRFCVFAVVSLFYREVALNAQVQTNGWVGYYHVGEREPYTFGIDPAHPEEGKVGGLYSDYSGRARLDGDRYWADLWYAPGGNAKEADLIELPGSQMVFRSGTTAGIIRGITKIYVPEMYGGDYVTLQLRVWDSRGGTIRNWAEVLSDDSVPRIASHLIYNYQLGGWTRDGTPELGSGSAFRYKEYMGLYIVPEPSPGILLVLIIGAIARRATAGRGGLNPASFGR